MHPTRSGKSEQLVTNSIGTNQIFEENPLKSGKKKKHTRCVYTLCDVKNVGGASSEG